MHNRQCGAANRAIRHSFDTIVSLYIGHAFEQGHSWHATQTNSSVRRIVLMSGERHAWHYMRAACAKHTGLWINPDMRIWH